MEDVSDLVDGPHNPVRERNRHDSLLTIWDRGTGGKDVQVHLVQKTIVKTNYCIGQKGISRTRRKREGK